MSGTEYGFDAARLRAARTAAGASAARIMRVTGVSERAVFLYLAGSRVPRPGHLVLLATAVGVAPADLCAVDQERLAHLRVYTGRSRAQMATVLGMAEATYRELENTGHRGRAARARYDPDQDRWTPWEQWAAPLFGVTPERLAAAEQRTQAHCRAERERRWERMRERDPARTAAIEEAGRRLRTVLHPDT
ncbi:helix-turn-helix domain-containing protein [Kitasatospora sp. NPDC058406]|uniref:helix-turn-helix domain-containing protein n=1 Tax=Kitasatospora sp. NPDC058406 TaxID=3346483 RepID=UPI00364DF0B6